MWGIKQRDFGSHCLAFVAFIAGKGRHKMYFLANFVRLRDGVDDSVPAAALVHALHPLKRSNQMHRVLWLWTFCASWLDNGRVTVDCWMDIEDEMRAHRLKYSCGNWAGWWNSGLGTNERRYFR
jgi:hypothetical protein